MKILYNFFILFLIIIMGCSSSHYEKSFQRIKERKIKQSERLLEYESTHKNEFDKPEYLDGVKPDEKSTYRSKNIVSVTYTYYCYKGNRVTVIWYKNEDGLWEKTVYKSKCEND